MYLKAILVFQQLFSTQDQNCKMLIQFPGPSRSHVHYVLPQLPQHPRFCFKNLSSMWKSEVNWRQSRAVTTAPSVTHLSNGIVKKGAELFWGYIYFGNKNKCITISCSTTENKTKPNYLLTVWLQSRISSCRHLTSKQHELDEDKESERGYLIIILIFSPLLLEQSRYCFIFQPLLKVD